MQKMGHSHAIASFLRQSQLSRWGLEAFPVVSQELDFVHRVIQLHIEQLNDFMLRDKFFLLCLLNSCDLTDNDIATHYPHRSRYTVLSVCGRHYDPVLAVYTISRAIFDCPRSKHRAWIGILIWRNLWRHVVIRVDANRNIRPGGKAGYRNVNLACMVHANHDLSPDDNLYFVYLYSCHD